MAAVRVIGCGNPDAGDDAAGLLAVREAASGLRAIDGVEVVEAGPATKVLDLLDGVDAVIVVDAVRAPRGGRAAGDLIRVEPGPSGLPASVGPSLSSHGFGLAEAIGLAVALGGSPRLVFLGVEAGDVTAGHGPSPAVEAALPSLVTRIVEEAKAMAREPFP